MRSLALLAFAAACTDDIAPGDDPDPVEEPGTETVSATFDVEIFSPFPSPTLPSFDTHDGARELERMTITFDHTLAGTVFLQNTSAVDLAEGDYVMDHYFNVIAQLGATTGTTGDDGGPPFLGPGSFWWQVSDPLGPAGSGTDTLERSFDEDILFEAEYDPVETPTYLQAMTDAGDVTVVIGGFEEVFFNFDPALEGSGVEVAWQVPSLRYSGEITVDYDFVPVE
jgi:hypothetical protein